MEKINFVPYFKKVALCGVFAVSVAGLSCCGSHARNTLESHHGPDTRMPVSETLASGRVSISEIIGKEKTEYKGLHQRETTSKKEKRSRSPSTVTISYGGATINLNPKQASSFSIDLGGMRIEKGNSKKKGEERRNSRSSTQPPILSPTLVEA